MENKKYANRIGYSDRDAFEILNYRNEKRIEIRELNAVLDNFKPEIIPGGFCGHCTNQNEQKYIYSINPNNKIVIIRKHKNGKWYDRNKNRYSLNDVPSKFYDYNF